MSRVANIHPNIPPTHPRPPNQTLEFDEYEDGSDTMVIDNDFKIKELIGLSKYSILYTNIRSLSKNIHSLRYLASELSPDFISLTEVFDPLSKYVRLQNYHDVILQTRTKSIGGGLGLYIRSCYTYSMIDRIN